MSRVLIREGNDCFHTQLHEEHERFAKLCDSRLRAAANATRLTPEFPPTKRIQGSLCASPSANRNSPQGGHRAGQQGIPYIAVDQTYESATNSRQTLEQIKPEELAESIRQHGLIQPVTIRPNASGFEIGAGSKAFRAAQLAELLSHPARIVDLDDAAAMEWQLVELAARGRSPI